MRRNLFLLPVLLASACDSDPADPPAPGDDVTAPVLSLVSAGDVNGDGLIDFHVTWTDPGRSTLGTRVSVRSLRPLRGPLAHKPELLDVWTISHADSGSVRFTEHVYAVLPAGDNAVEVRVTDAAGNVGVDTFRLSLAPLNLHRRIPLGTGTLANLLVCRGSAMVVIPAHLRMLVIDPDTYYLREIFNFWGTHETLGICSNDETVVHLAWGAQRFDIERVRWGDRMGAGGTSIAQSVRDPDNMYIAGTGGRVTVVDRMNYRTNRSFIIPGSSAQDIVSSLVLLPASERLIASVFPRRLVLLENDGTIVKEVPEGVGDLALSTDQTRVYAGLERDGLGEFSTADLRRSRTLPLDGVPRRIAIRDDGKRAFVTTDDGTGASHNHLVDLESWSIIEKLPRPRTSHRTDSGAMFEPAGTRLYTSYFTPQGSWLEIYIDRT